ncbi:hypothetical protein REC12_20060 [Desulfosporosinus sp. PR]|uniref:hypothetical protein n=1 Tax=Candidatus Desulfosporosinus nitrosoreducens TaxID=3401928 RepID=UPI0027F8BE35|nr:hypothetical protein [Desulfosporosinus sp. PR]MDQ7095893.1 hypothetical protein [Desulfosporosinus sp. PR]
MPDQEKTITSEDINEGKQAVRDYINALKSGNLEDLSKTLDLYQQEFYSKVHIGNS